MIFDSYTLDKNVMEIDFFASHCHKNQKIFNKYDRMEVILV